MEPFLADKFGNPSSLHLWGREARLAIDLAREQVAAAMRCDPAEICFVSSGTEANALAIVGAMLAGNRRRLIVSATEHHSVLGATELAAELGFETMTVGVDRAGLVDLDRLESLMDDQVGLVSVMAVNNETGVVQPIEAIRSICQRFGALFHTDAVQATGITASDADLATISSHKIHGPKGAAALIVNAGVQVKALIRGGGQERERRAGTESVASIVGFGAAASLLGASVASMRDRLEKAILDGCPFARRTTEAERAPHISHLLFDRVSAESLLIAIDRRGVAASSGAACSAGSIEPSHVLMAMGLSEEEALTGIRLSIGQTTTQEEVDYGAAAICEEAERVRAATR